ncbi:MAG: insulinase family protein [Clostridia bacterium]|jgi:predicted Zn-dependent peptidase|nr:insulinase family protein [Clostridia bacterium]
MKIIENKYIKEKMYLEKLENGLTVMILPRENVMKKYIIWGVNFGSIDNEFILPGEIEAKKVPDGVAHFLEHKMFEQRSGINSLDTLSALGVNANAYTTNDHTAYLYEATDNFDKALDEFMDYVQNPYYTDENVEKEKGIIAQEINMYEDSSEWKSYLNAMKCMYKDSQVRIDIAGSVKSIKEITKETLYLCYDNFYTPSNMALVVCGDFEPERILEEIKKRIVKHENRELPKRIYPNEQEEIAQKEMIQDMKLSNPIFTIGYKDKVQEDMVKRHIAIQIICGILFGKSSKLYKELTEQNILIGALSNEYDYSKNYAFLIISGVSRNPEAVVKRVREEIENAKKEGLNEADFIRNKKNFYGNMVIEYNSVEETGRMFLTDYFKGISAFEYLDKYEEVTKEYAEKILNEVFVEEKRVTSIVK